MEVQSLTNLARRREDKAVTNHRLLIMEENAWDDIFVNPHESHIAAGRSQGHEAGLSKGYIDGLDLGCTQGVAVGIEIGFLRKSCQMLLLRTSTGSDDVAKDAPPSTVHSKIRNLITSLDALTQLDTQFDDNDPDNNNVKEAEEVDLQNEMQRIRAKFKVITTQLKMQHYSLKRVMAENPTTDTAATAEHTTEW